jgi:hypothetical protein
MHQIYNFSSFFLKFKSNLLVKRVVLLNAAFAKAILDLISRVHLALFVTMLPKQLEHSTFSVVFEMDSILREFTGSYKTSLTT